MVGLAKVLLATSTEQTNLTKMRASVLGFQMIYVYHLGA